LYTRHKRPLTAEEVLLSRRTVTEHADKLVENSVMPAIVALVKDASTVGATTDFWEESYSKRSYLSLTVHVWEDGKFELTSVTAFVTPWVLDDKISEKVHHVLKEMLQRLSLPLPKVAFNTGKRILIWIYEYWRDITSLAYFSSKMHKNCLTLRSNNFIYFVFISLQMVGQTW
jgi:hypothetical protein